MNPNSPDFQEFQRFLTDNARMSLAHAGTIARGLGNSYIGTEHLLLGLLAQEGSLGGKILEEAGVTLGKHKMTPRISPNKTWEGFGGAALVAMIAGVTISLLALGQPWWVGILLGIVVLITATGGDLTESLIKRNLGVKDMSSWIPGHGGFLDRLDSLLPSAVGVYGVALSLGVFA